MSKTSKAIIFLAIFLTLVVISVQFPKTPVNTHNSGSDSQVGCLCVQFKDGTSESEVKAILQNINMTRNYRMTYDTNDTDERYYIEVDKDNWAIRNEFNKARSEEKKEWIIPSAHVIR